MPRRRLSPEERALWGKVVATTSPLRSDAPVADGDPGPPPQPIPLTLPAAPDRPRPQATLPMRPVEKGRVTLDLLPDPHASLERASPRMDARRFEKMKRGRLEPEARLDLHGMTLDRAHGALRSFVLAAHATGLRLVLVITGKGRPGSEDALAPQRHGAIRHSVPHWLAAPPLVSKVLQVAPAHFRHGGGGAYYVYLRRQR